MHGLVRRELYRLVIRAGRKERGKRMLKTGYNNDYEATAAIFFLFPLDADDTARLANEKV